MRTIPALQQVAATGSGLPLFRKRVLIIGTGPLARELCQVLVSKRNHVFQVVGFLDRDPARIGERLVNPGIIGTLDRLFEIVERYAVGVVAVCLEDRRTILPVQTLLDFKALGLEVVDGHQMYEREAGRLSIDLLKPSTLVFSDGFGRRPLMRMIKRLMDIVAAAAGLAVLAPLFALVAVLIKYDSPGPVFYRQVRVGLRGEPYKIHKLRSMRQDAELHGARWAVRDDPRITRIGRWLRRWRIDELPQLISVLKGDMSLVGPRPERPMFVQELRERIPYYDLRHTVRPGITGWAQIRFRYAASAEDSHLKLQYDLYYVKNVSLLLDLRILAETIRVVLLSEGAR